MYKIESNYRQVFGFDRVTIWLDHTEVRGLTAAIDPYCRRFVLIPELMSNNPVWKSRLEIYRPSKDVFTALVSCLGTTCRALPTYVELAWDVICQDAGQAIQVEAWRLKHLHLLNCRQSVKRFKTTWYYGRRAKATGGKRGRVLAIYANKVCKLRGVDDGEHCAHMELRLTGSAALQGIGIFSVSDLAAMDHIGLWRSAVHFLKLPNKKTPLGRLLHNKPKKPISGTAFANKANKLLKDHQQKGRFVLQNAIKEYPHLAQKAESIPFDEVLGDLAQVGLI